VFILFLEVLLPRLDERDRKHSVGKMRRSAVYGTNGAVASSQPLATQAGVSVLQRGGSAADASVAVAAALAVTEPCSNGVGGDCFALVYSARTQTVKAVMASGRSPRHLTLDIALGHADTGHLDYSSPHTVTVPGAVSGWVALVEQFGSGALRMADILAPAIALAESGFPVGPLTAEQWARSEELLRDALNGAGTFLINGSAPAAGSVFRNPDLAQTLRLIGERGFDGFYRGRVAEGIVSILATLGGVMDIDDLASTRAIVADTVSTTYRGHMVHQCPPPTHGVCVLLALNMLETFDVKSLGDHGSASHLHVLADCLRLAYADVAVHVADPDAKDANVTACWEQLLSKDYARKRVAEHMSEHRCVVHGAPGLQHGGTVQFSVVDGEGNAVSMVQSNYIGFGTGHVPSGLGFTLHNRGLGFSLETGHSNVLAGGKRCYHTIIPCALTDPVTGRLRAVLGCMGSFMQPQGQVVSCL
jgi:gamma-glutamyltranspeptidase / glutathione hydrolase